MNQKEIEEMFGPQEELHPDLKPHLYKDGMLGTCLKHPLVFSLIHHDALNHMTNQRYQAKLKALDEAEQKRKWHTYVFLHERPYRLDAFMDIELALDDCDYWKLLGQIWTDSENLHENYAIWQEALDAERDCREKMMTEDEQKFLADLDDEITIYRGYCEAHTEPHHASPFITPPDTTTPNLTARYHASDEIEHTGLQGFSWTLDKARAEWFARRFASHRGTPYVAKATIQKSNCIAYFSGRGEAEIVALPEDVVVIETQEVGE